MEPLHTHTAKQTLTKRLAAELQHEGSGSQMGAAPTAQQRQSCERTRRLSIFLHGENYSFLLSLPPPQALSRISRASPALRLPAGCGAAPAKLLQDEVEVEGF